MPEVYQQRYQLLLYMNSHVVDVGLLDNRLSLTIHWSRG